MKRRIVHWFALLEYPFFVALVAALGLMAYGHEHPAALAWRGPPALTTTVFNIGQGDVILVETSDGKQMLVDGGPDDTVLARLGETLAPRDRDLDLVVLTHPHADHVTGLVGVLERYTVKKIIMTGVHYDTPEYRAFKNLIEARHIPVEIITHAESFALGSARVAVLYPLKSFDEVMVKNVHDSTVVMKVSEGERSVLLTGDLEAPGEQEMIAAHEDLRADILKVGHHGSHTSSSDAFLTAVHPTYAAISVGLNNTYGHPHADVLERLMAHAIRFFRTDEDGTITFRMDSRHLCVSTTSGIMECNK